MYRLCERIDVLKTGHGKSSAAQHVRELSSAAMLVRSMRREDAGMWDNRVSKNLAPALRTHPSEIPCYPFLLRAAASDGPV